MKNAFIPLILLTMIIVIWEYHHSGVDVVFSGRVIIVTVTIAML